MAKEAKVEEAKVETPSKCETLPKAYTFKVVGEKYVVIDEKGNVETIGTKAEFEARFKVIG